MRYRLLVFATTLVAVQIAVAQNGRSGSCDANSCTTTFTFGPMGLPYLAGAAYSGQQTIEIVKNLPDGTHKALVFPPRPMAYRDSQGRTRVEHPIYASSPHTKPPIFTTLVEIQDPVASYMYVLDLMNRVAHRVHVQPGRLLTRPGLVDSGAESLGTKLLFGVMLTGQRTTSSTSTDVDEIWTDPLNGQIVLARKTSTASESTNTLSNYSHDEPDAALFQVPAGYAVVDESGPFTIVTPRH
jgi:hypothetical protein